MNSCAFAPPRTGKSVYSLGVVTDYLFEGRTVITNFPLKQDAVEQFTRRKDNRSRVTCCSPRPTSKELFALGEGWHPDYPHNEEKAGLLVIDEAGTWIPARSWNDPDRAEIIKWFTLSGKLGWDVLLLVQHPDLIDSAIRNSCIELFGRVMRTDRVKVPILGIKLPRFHVVQMRYGTELNAPKAFTKGYRGNSVYKFFDTHFKFEDFAPFSFWRAYEPIVGDALRRLRLSTVKKHPLAEKIQKIPCPQKRLELFRRFEACGAFSRPQSFA